MGRQTRNSICCLSNGKIYWQEYGEKITATIKDPSSSGKNMCYFGKKNKYELLSLGARDVLVVPAKKKVHNVDHRCMHLFMYMHLKVVGIAFTLCSRCCIDKAPGAVFRYSFVRARCMLQKGKK